MPFPNQAVNRNLRNKIIAIVMAGLGIAAVIIIGWQLTRDDGSKKHEAVVASATQGDTRLTPSQPAISTRTSPSTVRNNTGARLTARTGKTPASPTPRQVSAAVNAAPDSVEELPEVKQAHDALVAAHKRAADVMEKAMKQLYGDISFDAFQKVQNLPEVQQTRQVVAEAERRYTEAKSKAMEARSTK
jgi:hypothetical protein